MTNPTATMTPDEAQLDAIKVKQQATWASGDFAVIGTSLDITGELLCEAVGVEAGTTVLDVAAGNGNAAIAAAHRNARVIASDYVPELLVKAAARAEADGVPLATRAADAEALPWADRSFDTVVSVFGVMFAPRQERAASELVRVCRPGGRIGLVSWTPDSFVGEMFRTIGRHVPPPPVPSVFRWGMADEVAALLAPEATVDAAVTRQFVFRYESPEHFVDTFRAYYGPTNRAFAALDPERQDALEHDLIALGRAWNTSTVGAFAASADYLELVATRH